MKKNIGYIIAETAFIAYGFIMIWLLFGMRIDFEDFSGKYNELLTANINLVPFRTITEYIMLLGRQKSTAVINLFGNIIMFIPLGFFMTYLWRTLSSFKNFIVCFVSVIICIEILQMLTLLGRCDIDDLILNAIGGVIGYLVCKILTNKTKRRTSH